MEKRNRRHFQTRTIVQKGSRQSGKRDGDENLCLKESGQVKEPRECNAIHLKRQARLSKKEHREDALALRAEERRDKLRKAAVSCK